MTFMMNEHKNVHNNDLISIYCTIIFKDIMDIKTIRIQTS